MESRRAHCLCAQLWRRALSRFRIRRAYNADNDAGCFKEPIGSQLALFPAKWSPLYLSRSEFAAREQRDLRGLDRLKRVKGSSKLSSERGVRTARLSSFPARVDANGP